MFVVFDLDGTLVDSRADIVRATNFALAAGGRAPLPDQVVTSYVGDGARTLMARATGISESDPALEPALRVFLDYYSAHATDQTRPMTGALALLVTLHRRLPLALCTNKPRRTTERVLRALGMRAFFQAVSAGDDAAEKKPHPAPLLGLCSRVGIAPASTVMVGDGPQDVDCGRRAGARTVGIVGNIVPRAALAERAPDALLDGIGELGPLLYRWRRAQATKE